MRVKSKQDSTAKNKKESHGDGEADGGEADDGEVKLMEVKLMMVR